MTVIVETTHNVVVTNESGIPTVVVTAETVQPSVVISASGAQGPRGPMGDFQTLTTLQARTLLGIYVIGPTASAAGFPTGAIIIRTSE